MSTCTQSEEDSVSEPADFRFDREFALVRACCSCLPTEQRRALILEILPSNLDWARIFLIAEHHRVIPRVYRELTETPAGSNLSDFAAANRENVVRTFFLTEELIRVLHHLQAHGVEALAHKGPALAALLFDETSQRQFCDLDILVRPEDVLRAKAALAEIGYAPTLELSEDEERAYVASGYEYGFRSPDGRILIELQWRILPRFYAVDFDIAPFFRRHAKVDIDSVCVPTVGLEDLAVSLCLHAAKHLWAELSLVADIGQLTKIYIDWRLVAERAADLGVRRIVAVSFVLAHKLLKSPIPPEVRSIIEDDLDCHSPAIEISHLISNCREHNPESTWYFRWMMRLRERPTDRARLVWRLFSTASISEWSMVKLPRIFSPAYRVVRSARLAKRAFAFRGSPAYPKLHV